MHSSGINEEGELKGQLANPGSPGKMAIKTECVSVYVCAFSLQCFDTVGWVTGRPVKSWVLVFWW